MKLSIKVLVLYSQRARIKVENYHLKSDNVVDNLFYHTQLVQWTEFWYLWWSHLLFNHTFFLNLCKCGLYNFKCNLNIFNIVNCIFMKIIKKHIIFSSIRRKKSLQFYSCCIRFKWFSMLKSLNREKKTLANDLQQ